MVGILALPETWAAIGVVMALLWTFFGQPLVKFVEWALQQIPVVGGAAAGFAANAAAALAQWGLGWAETGAGAFVQLINVPTTVLQAVIGGTVTAVETLVAYVLQLGSTLVNDIAAVIGRVVELEQAATNAAGEIALSLTRIGQLFTAVGVIEDQIIPAGVDHAIAVAEQFVAEQVAQAEHIAAVGVAGAIQSAETFVGAETDRALKAEQAIQAAALGAVDALGRTVSGDISGLTGTLAGDVKTLEGAIGDVNALVQPIVAAGVVAGLTALVTKVATLERECIDPTCNYLSPQLPGLTSLADLALIGEVIALVAQAAHDPEGTASEIQGGIGGLLGAVNPVMGTLFGLSV